MAVTARSHGNIMEEAQQRTLLQHRHRGSGRRMISSHVNAAGRLRTLARRLQREFGALFAFTNCTNSIKSFAPAFCG